MTAEPRELPEPLTRANLAELAEEARAGGGMGIVCPRCACLQFADGKNVRNSIRVTGAVRRYRVCRACGKTWTTTEK